MTRWQRAGLRSRAVGAGSEKGAVEGSKTADTQRFQGWQERNVRSSHVKWL